MDQISIVIPSYNRAHMLWRSFEQVIDDPRVAYVTVWTDGCDKKPYFALDQHPKLCIMGGIINQGMMWAKMGAVSLSGTPWCILLDDDNILLPGYIDALYGLQDDIGEWQSDTIYCPDYAMPHFDYRAFAGKQYNKTNVADLIDKPHFIKHLNTCNYFVHRDTYLKNYVYNPSIK